MEWVPRGLDTPYSSPVIQGRMSERGSERGRSFPRRTVLTLRMDVRTVIEPCRLVDPTR